MPWLSRGEYRRLLRQLGRAEQRADQAESALSAERAAFMRDIRHLTSMLLRRAGSYPLPEPAKPAFVPDPVHWQPAPELPIDPGEYEALLATAADYGVDKAGVDSLLARERGEVI